METSVTRDNDGFIPHSRLDGPHSDPLGMRAIDVTVATFMNFVNLIVTQKSINNQHIWHVDGHVIFTRRLEHKARLVTEPTRQKGVYEGIYIFPLVGNITYGVKCIRSRGDWRFVRFFICEMPQEFPRYMWKLTL
jgi:hypothetical protein